MGIQAMVNPHLKRPTSPRITAFCVSDGYGLKDHITVFMSLNDYKRSDYIWLGLPKCVEDVE